MMYDYESDLIEFWGKVIFFFFFGAFILIWALVFYFVMYSFPFLFIPPPFHSPFDIFYHTFFLVRLCFLYSFFFYSWTDNHAHFYKNSFRKEISIKDPDSRRAWRSGLVGVCQSNIFPCMSLPLFSSSL